MDDTDFLTKAAGLLAQCSPDQRARLVDMAKGFAKADADAGGTAMDAKMVDPDAGKSFEERFPDSKRFLP